MTHPFGQDDALAGTLRGLIGIAERLWGHGALPFAARRRDRDHHTAGRGADAC